MGHIAMIKIFNINTITIIRQSPDRNNPDLYTLTIRGKYKGGKRWKRGNILVTKSELRDILLNRIIN